MCGISGKFYFNQGKRVTEEEIDRMTKILSHRGPDDTGIFLDQNLGLGHNRLSIIDLSNAGHQPMADTEDNLQIVFNGEIYNFLELRRQLEQQGIIFRSKTDTETILYLYKKYGVECLKHLQGMFAFAIWDKSKRQLFLARDRVGKKPLKYYYNRNVFIFASELKAILQNPEVPKEIDWEAIDEYLTYQYVPHPKTGFQNIFKLEPGHYLLITEKGGVTKHGYWDLNFRSKHKLSIEEWEGFALENLRTAVRARLVSDVPLGAHLSGGIDSSIIVALMAEVSQTPVNTYSIGFSEQEYNELPYARLVAQRYGTHHQEYILRPDAIEILPKLVYHYEEPYADSSSLPTWYLAELTRKEVTVALNGDGGDENFAGYTRYNAMKLYYALRFLPAKSLMKELNRKLYQITRHAIFRKGYRFLDSYSREPIDFYRRLIGYFDPAGKEKLYTIELKKYIQNSRWRSFLQDISERTQGLDWLDQLLYTDIQSYLPDDLLVKVDIASMAHGLEVRSPFLDHKFLEFTCQMPSSLKMKGYTKKYLLKKIAYRYLPKECIDRPKQGFGVPLEYWFRGKLNDYLSQELLSQSFLDFGFQKEGIVSLLKDHQARRQNYSNHLWALLMLNMWFKTWFPKR